MDSNLLKTGNPLYFQGNLDVGQFQTDNAEENPNKVSMLALEEVKTLRSSWFGDFYLIVRVNEEAGDVSRAGQGVMPFLADHDRTDFLGQVKNPRFQDTNLFAEARISTNTRPQEVLTDIKAGLRPGVSVGFMPLEINDISKRGDEVPTLEVAKWSLLEISSVTTPQLANAQVQYSQEAFNDHFAPFLKKEEPEMDPVTEVQATPNVDWKEEILKLGVEYGDSEAAVVFALQGGTKEDYLKDILGRRMQTTQEAPPPATSELRPEVAYSFAKAIAFAADPEPSESLREHCGLEREASRITLNNLGKQPLPGRRGEGLMIPWEELLKAGGINFVTTNAGSEAGNYIPTAIMQTAIPFQEMAVVMPRATVYSGLVGTEQVPILRRYDGDPTPANRGLTPKYPADGQPATGIDTSEDADFGQRQFTPKIITLGTELTNLAIYQSSGRVESDVLRFLMSELNYEFDEQVINGPGSANRISGLLNQASGTDYNEDEVYKFADDAGGTLSNRYGLSWDRVLQMIKTLHKQRLITPDGRVPGAAFLLSPTLLERARKTMRFAINGTGDAQNRRMFVADEDAEGGFTIAGYPVIVSNHLQDNESGTVNTSTFQAIFGVLSEVAVGTWGGVQVYYDGVSKMGITRIGLQAWLDAQFPHRNAFATIALKN